MIKAESIDTNEPQRDEHLRSTDFFDAAGFPEIRFESTEIGGVDGTSFRVARRPDDSRHDPPDRARGDLRGRRHRSVGPGAHRPDGQGPARSERLRRRLEPGARVGRQHARRPRRLHRVRLGRQGGLGADARPRDPRQPPQRLVQPRAPACSAGARPGRDGDRACSTSATCRSTTATWRRPAFPSRVQRLRDAHRGRGRGALRDARVQPRHLGRAEERDRLGLAAARASRCSTASRSRSWARRPGSAAPPTPSARCARRCSSPARRRSRRSCSCRAPGEKFDEHGELIDPETRADLKVLLEGLEGWVTQVREALAVAA